MLIRPMRADQLVLEQNFYEFLTLLLPFETVAKYSNRITDSENYEFLIIFDAKIQHFASQSDQNRGQ